jgi:hypothetical protein
VKTATGAWNQDVSSTLMELRTLREFSERHGLSMTVVEKIFYMFKIYDSDQSGYIDKGEFMKLLMHVLKIAEVDESDLDRAWRDHGRGGSRRFFRLVQGRNGPCQELRCSEQTLKESHWGPELVICY